MNACAHQPRTPRRPPQVHPSSTRFHAPAPLLLVSIASLVVAGCGGSGIERVPVSGRVTYQGQPVPNGQVLFFPVDDEELPMSGAVLRDGHYEADAKGGVPVGRHRVRVLAYRYHPKIVQAGRAPEKLDMNDRLPKHQYLPAKYNTETQLEVLIPSGSGPVTEDFELEE